MMKIFLSLCFILGTVSQHLAQNNFFPFELSGKITGLAGKTMYFIYNKKIDTIYAKKDKFTLKGTLNEPTEATLQLDGLTSTIFLEPNAKVKVVGDVALFEATTASGTILNNDFTKYKKQLQPYLEEIVRLKKRLEDVRKEGKSPEEFYVQARETQSKMLGVVQKFMYDNPTSPASAYLMTNFLYNPPQELQEMYSRLQGAALETKYAKRIKERIERNERTVVGATAMDFTQNDPDGKPISLNSFRGQVVLIDFWASWCGPCRMENPNLVQAYQKYKDKGFTILGISLDRNKNNWLDAIQKDKLTWTHVSDLKFWQNEVAILYGIQSIPANFLLDKTGKIVAKGLRGEALGQKLAELLDSEK